MAFSTDVEINEVMVTLAEALMSTATTTLEEDKINVGALDSACNKSCAGELWMKRYMECIARAPVEIQSLVTEEPATDLFRFGNGGTLQARRRVRCPVVVGDRLVLV